VRTLTQNPSSCSKWCAADTQAALQLNAARGTRDAHGAVPAVWEAVVEVLQCKPTELARVATAEQALQKAKTALALADGRWSVADPSVFEEALKTAEPLLAKLDPADIRKSQQDVSVQLQATRDAAAVAGVDVEASSNAQLSTQDVASLQTKACQELRLWASEKGPKERKLAEMVERLAKQLFSSLSGMFCFLLQDKSPMPKVILLSAFFA